ncbi:MAG: hypothetical protein GY720_11270 [bacterium]|nr:hypothetical protein [bacterium]
MTSWLGRFSRPAMTALLASVLFAGAALAARSPSQSVWIDAPLDGSVIEADRSVVAVVGHASGDTGIDRARLRVDGQRLAVAPLESEPGQLVTVEFEWEPDPGIHVLELWARNADGDWEGPAIATVTVEGDPEPPPTTATPTTSGAPTISSAPSTSGACLFEPPILVSPVDGKISPLTANTLTWAYTGCRLALEFQVEVSTTPNFTEVVASANVQAASDWLTPNLLCDSYWWRVRAQTFDDLGPWSTPWSFTISFRGC